MKSDSRWYTKNRMETKNPPNPLNTLNLASNHHEMDEKSFEGDEYTHP